MKKSYIITIIFLTSVMGFCWAQTPDEVAKIQQENNTSALKQLEYDLNQSYTQKHEEALREAKIKGWPIKKVGENGESMELMQLNPDGSPIYFTTNNVNAAISSRANYLNSGGRLGLNLNGQSMTAYIWDEGFSLNTHQELKNRVRFGDNANSYSNHATHVAGTIMAAGVNPRAKGMAYQANAVTSDWNYDISEVTAAAARGMLLSNHSYGYNGLQFWAIGAYTDWSYYWDNIMYNAPHYLMVKAAGNNGNNYINGSPLEGNYYYDKLDPVATAKNGLVIAAANPANIDSNGNLQYASLASFSSPGPTDDYRIKPDLAGDGVNLYSCVANSNYAYDIYSGTSMASPNVTGTLLLLQQHFKNLNGNFMRAATLKGLALHTADDFGIPGPDANSGWGYINAKFAAETISKRGSKSIIRQRKLDNGNTFTLEVQADGKGPLKASISWTDVPGSINNGYTNDTTPKLVNDLDIRVTKGSTVYYPYKLTSVRTNGKGDNRVDPFERVDIPNASGTYTITVSHKGNLTYGLQRYSLIVTGIEVQDDEIRCPDVLNVTSNVTSGNDVQSAGNKLIASNTINNGANANYSAGTTIILKPGFHARQGSKLKANIAACQASARPENNTEERKVVTYDDEEIVMDTQEEAPKVEYLKISPNPNNGIFKVFLEQLSSGSVQISDSFGNVIYENDFKDEKELAIDISNKAKGIYLIRVVTLDGSITSNKVIVN